MYAAGEIGDRARHLQHTQRAASGELPAIRGAFQELALLGAELHDAPQPARIEPRVQPTAAFELRGASEGDRFADLRGLADRRRLRDIAERYARHFDVQIEPVEQRPGDPARVLLEPAGGAVATVRAVAAESARTRIHRGDELELRGKRKLLVHTRNACDSALERFAQRLERRARELR